MSVQGLQPQELNILVVIVCYKVPELTIDCLHSLAPQIADVPGTKVAVCENGTGADAVETLASAIVENEWSDWVMLKAISPNRGFTGGNNAILRDAMAWPTPPRYFLLLNADTIVKPGAIADLFRNAEASSRVGIVGPQIVSAGGET